MKTRLLALKVALNSIIVILAAFTLVQIVNYARDAIIFQTGSIGKQLTAVAIMLQVEDGKLSLSDPVTKFFPDAPETWRDITVRHLLTHTSGIPDYEEDKLDFRRDYTEDELARFASATAYRSIAIVALIPDIIILATA